MDFAATIRTGFTRWQASGLHLLISAIIAAAVLTVMLGVWYPRPLFEAQGGMGLVFILVGVDVVIGPLITLVIFKSGKPGLKFDLAVIAALQLAALIYGGTVVFAARPVFLVLVKDQFEVVTAAELHPKWLEEARRPEFRALPVSGPVLVMLEQPGDETERQAIIQSALAGERDAQHFTKYYVPYPERARAALSNALPVETVRRRYAETARVIDAYLASSGRKDTDVRYFAMRTRYEWIAVLVDARTGDIVNMLLVPDS
ncbi:MAG: hypothetical protein A3I02_10370 [Betaproteobacteria bacterium RIFCSPLOWO2_02_FULL_67_26]|nr:MAG: hypothetical protein A3I02_10370 [Betaproteobacteria bacterium RIFCSPLOWO2_02_FULL_67_26]